MPICASSALDDLNGEIDKIFIAFALNRFFKSNLSLQEKPNKIKFIYWQAGPTKMKKSGVCAGLK